MIAVAESVSSGSAVSPDVSDHVPSAALVETLK
jgi:hypothetical protein